MKQFFFLIVDVPPDIVSLTITVLSRGKRGKDKDTEVAELTIDLSSLKNGQEKEDWYALTGMTPIGEWGSLRLRMRYCWNLNQTASLAFPIILNYSK